MQERVLAATTFGAFKTEIREYPVPDIPPDAGILKIEAAGVCGSDWQAYQSDRPARIMWAAKVRRERFM
jgi:threonine dehydrogenase-like Zn-dependent dehydrogenase